MLKAEKLPQDYLTRMKSLLGPEYEDYLASFSQPSSKGLRVNERKLPAGEFPALAGQPLKPVPWISNGYYLDGPWQAAKDPYYYAGLYYLQEPSAMTPASRLPVLPGDRVLDLCAAPGGKATELGARLNGKGLLWANDISASRARALVKNLELWGIPNLCVTSEDPEHLAQVLPEFFDKILVDAPCSGEGMFRREPEMVKDWINKGPSYYAPLQKKILSAAAAMLKPGGLLLYSTCTFSPEENEDNIRFLLEQFPEFSLKPLEQFPGAFPGIDLPGVLRLFPHRIQGEGHFLALLKKAGPAREEGSLEHVYSTGRKNNPSLPASFLEFMDQLKPAKRGGFDLSLKEYSIKQVGENLYLLPPEFDDRTRLRFLRTGLLLGEIKKDRFQPSQALAMALKPEQWEGSLRLAHDDPRVIRYLKGESISLTPAEQGKKGWRLICTEEFPLGWAKEAGPLLKNKYCPGWRYV